MESNSLSSGSFKKSYDILRTWSMNSLDLVKAELLSLCFPIFVHSYIALVEGENSFSASQDFWKSYSHDHLDYHIEEMQALSMLTSADQLKSSEFMAMNTFVDYAQKSRFIIRLSSLAYRLLTSFLVQNELDVVVSIINTKCQFQRLSDDTDSQEVPYLLSELVGYSAGLAVFPEEAEVDGSNPLIAGQNRLAAMGNIRMPLFSTSATVALGVPGKPLTTCYGSTSSSYNNLQTKGNSSRAGGNGGLKMPNTKDDPLYNAWLTKIIRPNVILKKKRKQVESKDGNDNHEVNEGNIGDPRDPSIMFSTITNTYDGMCCMHINGGITQIVTGYRDAAVRVWRLDQQRRHRRASSSQNDEYNDDDEGSSDEDDDDGELDGDDIDDLKDGGSGGLFSTRAGGRFFGRSLRANLHATGRRGRIGSINEVIPKTQTMLLQESLRSVQRANRRQERLKQRDNAPAGSSSSAAHDFNANTTGSGGGSKGTKSASSGVDTGYHPAMLELRGHSAPVLSVHQDDATDRLLISSSADESIRLWDTSIAQCVVRYSCLSPAWDVKFSPIGYYFASANQDKTVAVHVTDRMHPIRIFTGHLSDVNCVAWHGNAALLASGSDDRTVRLWDLRSGTSARLFRGCPSPISCVAVAPHGHLVAAGCDNGRIFVWDTVSSRLVASLCSSNTGPGNNSTTGGNSATGTSSTSSATGKAAVTAPVHSVAFSHDSSVLISGGADCAVKIWDIASSLQEPSVSAVRSSGSSFRANGTSEILSFGGSSSQTIGMNHNDVSGLQSSNGIATLPYHKEPPPPEVVVITPLHTFYTKFSPVFHVNYTPQNLAYAGGPFSMQVAMGGGSV